MVVDSDARFPLGVSTGADHEAGQAGQAGDAGMAVGYTRCYT